MATFTELGRLINDYFSTHETVGKSQKKISDLQKEYDEQLKSLNLGGYFDAGGAAIIKKLYDQIHAAKDQITKELASLQENDRKIISYLKCLGDTPAIRFVYDIKGVERTFLFSLDGEGLKISNPEM